MNKWDLVAVELTKLLVNKNLTVSEEEAVSSAIQYLGECGGVHTHAPSQSPLVLVAGEPALDLKLAPNAYLWIESPTLFLEGWGGKNLPNSFHAYAERLYKAYKELAKLLHERNA